jgi:two-component system, response regulator PdtaR
MLKVLIAEDEPLIVFTLRGQLEQRDCEIVGLAKNGKEAVELCRSEHPEVVLMDISMPEMDGVEATRQIMQACPTCVVMLTAHGSKEQVAEAEEAGAMAYLVKPFSGDQILPAVAMARKRFKDFLLLRKEAADLQESLAVRQLIEQAKGLLMQRAGLSESAALNRLQKLALEQRRPIKTIAEKIIAAAAATRK